MQQPVQFDAVCHCESGVEGENKESCGPELGWLAEKALEEPSLAPQVICLIPGMAFIP